MSLHLGVSVCTMTIQTLFTKKRGQYHATISCKTLAEYNTLNLQYRVGRRLTLCHAKTGKRVAGRVVRRAVGPFKGPAGRTVARFVLQPAALR